MQRATKYPVTVISLFFGRRRQNGIDIFFLQSIKRETKQLFSIEVYITKVPEEHTVVDQTTLVFLISS